MSAPLKISSGQQKLILDGLHRGKRIDGRGQLDMRTVYIETDVMDSSDGSSRIRIGKTDIIVCSKLEIEPCDKGHPEEGKVRFGFDFESLPARPYRKSVKESIASEMLATLKRLANVESVNLRKLCIVRGLSCWSVNVTVQVLSIDGSLLDAAVIGVKCALFTTKIPRLIVSEGESSKWDITVEENAFDDCDTVDVSRMPIMLSVYNLVGTDYTYLDATLEEELLCTGIVRVAVSDSGEICNIVKSGTGALNMDTIILIMQTAKLYGEKLHKELLKQLRQEPALPTASQNKGFVHFANKEKDDNLIVVDLQ